MFEPSVVFVDEPLLDVDVDAVADSSVGQWLAVLRHLLVQYLLQFGHGSDAVEACRR